MPRKPIKNFGFLRKPLHKVLQPKRSSPKVKDSPTKSSGNIIERPETVLTAEGSGTTPVFRRVFVASSRKRTSSGNKVSGSSRMDKPVSFANKGTQKPNEQLHQRNSQEREAAINRDFEIQLPSVHLKNDWESRVKILSHGDMLIALNCVLPHLKLVPSVANPKKPMLDQNFSLFSDSPETLRNVFGLAKKYNAGRHIRSITEVSPFIKERSQLSGALERIIFLELEILYPSDENNNKAKHQRDFKRSKSLDAFIRSKKKEGIATVQSQKRMRVTFVSYREALMQSGVKPNRKIIVRTPDSQANAKESKETSAKADDEDTKPVKKTTSARTPRVIDILDESIFRENHDLYKINILRKHLPDRCTEMDQLDSASQTLYDFTCIIKEKTNLIWALNESSDKSKSSYSAIVRKNSSENVTFKNNPHPSVKIVRPTKSPESEINFTILNTLTTQRTCRIENRKVQSAPASESSTPVIETSTPGSESSAPAGVERDMITELERNNFEREGDSSGEKINEGSERKSDSLKDTSTKTGTLYPKLDDTFTPKDPHALTSTLQTSTRSHQQRVQCELLPQQQQQQQRQRPVQYYSRPIFNIPRQQYCPACHPSQYSNRPHYQTSANSSFPYPVFPRAAPNPVALHSQIATLRQIDPRMYRNSQTATMNLHSNMFRQLSTNRFTNQAVFSNQAGISFPPGRYRMTTVSELERQILEQSRAFEENNIRLQYERLDREGEEQYSANDSNGNALNENDRTSLASRFSCCGSYPPNQATNPFKRFF